MPVLQELCNFKQVLADAKGPICSAIAKPFHAIALQHPKLFLEALAHADKAWKAERPERNLFGSKACGSILAFYNRVSKLLEPADSWKSVLYPHWRTGYLHDASAVKRITRFFEDPGCRTSRTIEEESVCARPACVVIKIPF